MEVKVPVAEVERYTVYVVAPVLAVQVRLMPVLEAVVALRLVGAAGGGVAAVVADTVEDATEVPALLPAIT
jgi:hypothetical protein